MENEKRNEKANKEENRGAMPLQRWMARQQGREHRSVHREPVLRTKHRLSHSALTMGGALSIYQVWVLEHVRLGRIQDKPQHDCVHT